MGQLSSLNWQETNSKKGAIFYQLLSSSRINSSRGKKDSFHNNWRRRHGRDKSLVVPWAQRRAEEGGCPPAWCPRTAVGAAHQALVTSPPSSGDLCQVNVECTGKSSSVFGAGDHGPDAVCGHISMYRFQCDSSDGTQTQQNNHLRVTSHHTFSAIGILSLRCRKSAWCLAVFDFCLPFNTTQK